MIRTVTTRLLGVFALCAFGTSGALAWQRPEGTGVSPPPDPLMAAARSEMAASNGHDLRGFLHAFTSDAVVLVDAPPYSYRGAQGLADFFEHNLLGSKVACTIKPGAPQTEDRVGDDAYLEMVVNVRATDAKGDSFNDPIQWIGVLARHGDAWLIRGLVLTSSGG